MAAIRQVANFNWQGWMAANVCQNPCKVGAQHAPVQQHTIDWSGPDRDLVVVTTKQLKPLQWHCWWHQCAQWLVRNAGTAYASDHYYMPGL
jgi:hypothetical protein